MRAACPSQTLAGDASSHHFYSIGAGYGYERRPITRPFRVILGDGHVERVNFKNRLIGGESVPNP